jgi:SpoVK/Ycf46/Vps4 family AAA+-type ATPase
VANAEQLKALIRSYTEGDDTRFYRVALQLAAHEARHGHAKLATELRKLIDEAREKRTLVRASREPIPISRPRGELQGLLSVSYPDLRLPDMVLPKDVRDSLQRLLKEHRQQHKLRRYSLYPRRKLLLIGPPGTGKSMTGRALAGELNLPLLVVRFDALITKFMGETAAKLRLIFDAMNQTRGVYLFDEFDAIGAQRAMPNDIGEIRRVLNSFLQFLEEEESESLIVAATNYFGILDPALFRRFDDVIQYQLPSVEIAKILLRNRLASFAAEDLDWDQLVKAAEGLSHGELVRACEDALKEMVLEDRDSIRLSDVRKAFLSRKIQKPNK